jgi:beta-lactamase class A
MRLSDFHGFRTHAPVARMITRRRFGGLAGAAAAATIAGIPVARAAGLATDVARIEAESGGRLGVAVLDTRDGTRVAHRGDERFPMCSTFKLLAAAAILARVDTGRERLDRRVRYGASQLVEYSPVTKDHVGGAGMTLEALCEAAMTLSDNTAGNLLLEALGGPAGLTQYARTLGDPTTTLDRIETALNEATPGDPRDTTTPAAMLEIMRQLLVDDTLSAGSRERLTGWLLANKTGDKRLRAGLPADWRVGDKTGTGGNGSANDIAVVWPPGRAPILVAVYFTGSTVSDEARNAVIANAGRIVVAGFA